jgi:hypothetical protein
MCMCVYIYRIIVDVYRIIVFFCFPEIVINDVYLLDTSLLNGYQ